jgi:hypothetical protein
MDKTFAGKAVIKDRREDDDLCRKLKCNGFGTLHFVCIGLIFVRIGTVCGLI